jgi:hypothetical protein
MGLQPVPYALYRDTRKAAEDIYRYDRIERYCINQLLDAGREDKPVEGIVIKTVETALRNHAPHHQSRAA